MPVERVETKTERLAMEAQQKQDAETAAARGEASEQSQPITQQSLLQYMPLVEEGRKRDQENQNKFMQHILSQTGQGRDNGRRGVSLSDFQNTRPVSFATAAEPMDAEDWLRDTERKLNTVDCNDEEKRRYTTYLLTGPAASWWEGSSNETS